MINIDLIYHSEIYYEDSASIKYLMKEWITIGVI